MNTIAVIDYGMGNLRSVAKALEFVAPEATVVVTHQAERIRAADRILFPGVGALRDCMAELERLKLPDLLREAAASKPFMGICLGMQALLDHSEENEGTPGLGIIPGQVRHFDATLRDRETGERLKIPHMGWNQVHQSGDHPMWHGIEQNSRFYFVHGYYVEPAQQACRAGTTQYGVEFTSVISAGNVFAAQFHPEKSQQAGLALLRNFVSWDGSQ
ncbi:MAG TPA: imidazole glycerol phosphate synthase subunit HisH [Candidatus Tenderia sp.]|nr:imidazole glycerol phosphate synthase subunit HisH [Candidatus Tenderia sp.]